MITLMLVLFFSLALIMFFSGMIFFLAFLAWAAKIVLIGMLIYAGFRLVQWFID